MLYRNEENDTNWTTQLNCTKVIAKLSMDKINKIKYIYTCT